MATKLSFANSGVIEVSDDQVATFERNGWTKVEKKKPAPAEKETPKAKVIPKASSKKD